MIKAYFIIIFVSLYIEINFLGGGYSKIHNDGRSIYQASTQQPFFKSPAQSFHFYTPNISLTKTQN